MIKFLIIWKEKHCFFADTKLQVDQIKKKIEENSLSHYLLKTKNF